MKTPVRIAHLAVLAAALATTNAAIAATSEFLDQNGTTAGFWDGHTTPIIVDMANSNEWTTSAAGTTAPTTFAVGDFVQIGATGSDFSTNGGATIELTADPSGTLGASPGGIAVLGTNCTVNWITAGNNSHFGNATILEVTNGSTLIFSGGNWNWNAKTVSYLGGGTIIASNSIGNNDSTTGGGGIIVNMIGGTLELAQKGGSTFGNGTNASGTGFTLTNGTVDFVSPQSFSTVFAAFTNGVVLNTIQTVKLFGGAMDNLSGGPGTLNINTGAYLIGASNFTYLGSSQNMSLGTNKVLLTNGVSSQITVNGNTFTIAGPISDGGNNLGITKTGAGTLVMTGANTYTGPTVAAAGTLDVSTAGTGNSSYTVDDGATLEVSVEAVGQSLAMSSLTVGTNAGATLQFDVGDIKNPATAPINLGAGALTVNGFGQVSFASVGPVTNYPSIIPLVKYGTASGNISGLTLGSFPAVTPPFQGYISNDTVDAVVDLVLTNGLVTAPPGPPQTLTWVGETNGVDIGNWDLTTSNWSFSGLATNYVNLTTNTLGDLVVFDDTLTGTSLVNLTRALSPTSITFNNVNSNYVFTGTGSITGATSLLMNSNGTVTLDNSGNNNFTGGIIMSNGVIQLGNNDTNGNPGTGSITMNNTALVFDRTDSSLGVTAPFGPISGTGLITNNGTGTITLSGVQPVVCGVVVNAGALSLIGPNNNPSTLSGCTNLIINGGSVVFQSDNVMGTTTDIPITVNPGGALTGNGTSSHITGLLTLNGGTLTMGGNQNNTGFGTWDLFGGVLVPGTNITATISTIDVVPCEVNGTIFNVTNGNTPSGIDLLVSGSLINGTSEADTGVYKIGNGLMVLDNNDTYSHGTFVDTGTLQLGMPADTAALTPVGPGNVSLATNSLLYLNSGKGVTIAGIISDDGTGTVLLNGGTNIFAGVDTYSGPTILNSGSRLNLTNGASINGSKLITVSNAALDISAGGPMNNSGALSLTNSSLIVGTNVISSIGTLGISNTTVTFPVFPPNVSTVNISVSGGFSTGGSANTLNLTAVPGFLAYPTNVPLIKYGTFGNVGGNNNLTALGLTLPALGAPNGYLTNDVNNNSIDLVLLSDTNYPIMPLIWRGQANANWDILTTSNWVLSADGVTPFAFQNGDSVTLDDTATGPTSINVTTTVSPLSITFNNSSSGKTYTLSGAGSIGGSTSISLNGTGTVTLGDAGGDNFTGGITENNGGTLILTNANTSISGGINILNGSLTDQHSGIIAGGLNITGGVNILLDQTGTNTGGSTFDGGFVQVGNNDTNGSLPVGNITNNTTIVFNRIGTNGTVVAGSVVYGSGGVTNNNTGTINWFSTNNFIGPTVLNAGIFIMSGPNVPSSGFHGSSELIINNGAQVQVAVDNSLSGRGSVNVLPVFVNAGGTLTGAPGADAGAGTSCHLQGLLTLNGGTLANSGTSSNYANGSWDLDDGVATGGSNVTSTITALCVVPSQIGGTEFNIAAATPPTPSGIDLDVTGTIIHGTSQPDWGIIKTGNGIMRLSNTNTFLGLSNNNVAVSINQGVLIVNAAETPGVSGPLGRTTPTNAATIDFNGGTLQYSSANNFDYSSRFAQSQSYSIDTGGQNVTFATGFIFGSSVTKLGTGTLTLASTTNSYSGATVVGGGTLATTTATTGSSSYSVTNGATLDVQVSGAGTQLVMSGLTLGLNAAHVNTLMIDTLATGNPTIAPVNAGTLTTNSPVNITLAGTALTAGTFPLIAYSGASQSAGWTFTPPSGFTGSLSDNNAGLISVTLAVSAPTRNANITKAFLSGTNLVIQGTNNNTPNTNFHYQVLSATNLSTALSSWTVLVTNGFNPDGTFDYTNPIVPGTPQQFFDVKIVP